jgi:hypothetical protein
MAVGLAVMFTVWGSPGEGFSQGLLDQLQINGYGTWSYGETDNNHYAFSGPEGEYEHVFAALTFIGSVSEDVTVFIQPNFENKDESFDVDLAFAFAEWRLSDSFKVRAGRVRQPFGIYAEIYDVGVLRPFLSLPQSVYNAAFASRSYNGVGITGTIFTAGDWNFDYDLYAGQLDQKFNMPGINDQVGRKVKDTVGGRFIANTPLTGLRFGMSVLSGEQQADYTGEIPIDEADQTVWGLFGEYLIGKWSVRTEYVHQVADDLFTDTAAYAEVAYWVTDAIQVATRWETWDRGDSEDQLPPGFETLLDHDEIALAVNYWISPKMVFKLEYHDIEGNRFAGPEDLFAAFIAGGLQPSTQAIQLGVNFAF